MADDREDFEALLNQSFGKGFAFLTPGDRITGRVVGLGQGSLLVDVGQRCEGVVLREEFTDEELAGMQIGDPVEVYVVRVTGTGAVLSRAMKARGMDLEAFQEAARSGVPVEGKVEAENKGGYSVELSGGAKGFVPHSQIEYGFGPRKAPAEHVGQTYQFRVLEVRGRDVILSRAALQREQVEAEREKILAGLREGLLVQAPVVKTESFGVFVDLGGGVNALVPMSELSWSRSDEVKAGLKPGDVLTVKILRVETKDGRPRISASLKQAGENPWTAAADELVEGRTVRGRVTRLVAFGAFVEVLPGIEGLLHVSEMAVGRVRGPGDVVKPGQEVEVMITSVDRNARRVGLSLKALEVAKDAIPAETLARFQAPPSGTRAAEETRGMTAFELAMKRAEERARIKRERGGK